MILIVAGVAGSGKTTVGELVAARLGWEFADGDSFHPAANIAKMKAGHPLADEDRWPWLEAIGSWMDDRLARGQSAVVACSALKRSYRDVLLTGRDQVSLIFLQISPVEDEARLKARHGHFFTEPLLASQWAAMEVPDASERAHVLEVRGTAEQTADEIIRLLGPGAV
jgi:gluconokinase